MDRRSRSPSQDPRFGEAVGRTIKVLRADRGLARKDLAEEAGISYSYLTEIENGNKPPSNTVLSGIAAALGVQLHEIIADAERRLETEEPEPDRQQMWSPLPWEPESGEGPAPPSVRKLDAAREWRDRRDESRSEELRPTYPSARGSREHQGQEFDSGLRAHLQEFEALLPRLSSKEREAVLDLLRRLAR